MSQDTDRDVLAHVPAVLSYPAIALRPAVAWFAATMEAKLRQREDRGDWIACSPDFLLGRLEEELEELKAELESGTPITILDEGVDVANFAMMLADVFGRLGPAGFTYAIGRTPAWGPEAGPWEALRLIGGLVPEDLDKLHDPNCASRKTGPGGASALRTCTCQAAERLARRVRLEVRG